MTGVSERTLASWEAAAYPPGRHAARDRDGSPGGTLAEVMKPDYIATWLTTPCGPLEGFKPVEILEDSR